jgi:hypothetical protein
MRVRGQRYFPVALPLEKRPVTHCVGGWVGPRTGLDWCGKSRPRQNWIPGPSRPQKVAKPTTLFLPTKV